MPYSTAETPDLGGEGSSNKPMDLAEAISQTYGVVSRLQRLLDMTLGNENEPKEVKVFAEVPPLNGLATILQAGPEHLRQYHAEAHALLQEIEKRLF